MICPWCRESNCNGYGCELEKKNRNKKNYGRCPKCCFMIWDFDGCQNCILEKEKEEELNRNVNKLRVRETCYLTSGTTKKKHQKGKEC